MQPIFDSSSPVSISIVSTSFAEPPPPGFWESVFFFLSTRMVFSHRYAAQPDAELF